MDKQDPHYTVTVYVAAPGTPLALSGGTSAAGHMYYVISDGKREQSYGFAPKEHGESSGPGKVYDTDLKDYKEPYYARTMEITKAQYDKLQQFGDNPAKYKFDMEYGGLSNSCIDFTWGALNHAGLHRKTLLGIGDKRFDGELKPLENIQDIKSIKAPIEDSPLNSEHQNKMPKRSVMQWLLTEQDQSDGTRHQSGELAAKPGREGQMAGRGDPLLSQAEDAVRRLEKGLCRDYDSNSERLAASAACLAKENGLTRIDHVVLSRDAGPVRQGENLFVVQGELNNPAHLRAHIRTDEALARPVEQSLAQLQALNDSQRLQQTPQVAQPEQVLTQQHGMV
ncbi:XVIPCD domain-containing protein [Pseudoxanthomonas composti]|uniref:X-Tfes XVIPCD domain-containing protein n=1 Tax=Pseudoxanthomonas composti TaxID=2137479 RepID=A0A4Q1JW91_9GAMM|nr:XVIPCD domain-containing protein [Pseudoxanthomonas composti]RXR06561.1 hypothetical protein EPA99_07935 [Pseudoxanthomonas composti]